MLELGKVKRLFTFDLNEVLLPLSPSPVSSLAVLGLDGPCTQ